MVTCTRCDAANPDGANFCARCGNSLVNQHPGSSTAPLPPSGHAVYPPQNPQQQVWVAPPTTQGTVQRYPPQQQVQPPYQQFTPPPNQVNVVRPPSAAPRYYQPLPATGGNRKSLLLAFVLTFFLGPFGMFYSTVGGAILMLVISIGAAVATSGVGLFVTQIMCIIWGVAAADSYNKSH